MSDSACATIDAPERAFASEDTERPRWYFDASRGQFVIEDARGDWMHIGERDFNALLASSGFRTFADKPSNELISPLEAERLRAIREDRVDYCGNLAGRKRGFYVFGDTRCLVTRSPALLEPLPAPADCPRPFSTLEAFFAGLLAPEGGEDQREYLFAWWQHMLRALYEGEPVRGMALVLAGERSCGKTLLKDLIVQTAGKREVYPYAWMLGRDNFNRELTEAVVWTVDDEVADTTHQARNRFAAEIKKVTSNSAMRCRGMHRDGITVEPLRRLIILVNDEPDALQVLPELTEDVSDKMLILKGFYSEGTVPRGRESEKRALFHAMLAELPFFLHWLLYDFEVSEDLLGSGRFGVAAYCHPDVFEAVHQISGEARLLELIERGQIYNSIGEWRGRPSDLRVILLDKDSPLSRQDRDRVPEAAWIGRRLARLQKHYPERFRSRRTAQGAEWTITSANPPPMLLKEDTLDV